ncbi:hypothetical protein B0I08_103147 [Glaciihabitans tibetensis]|uniref:Glycerophosphoryl diester phosphodiesterase family protein n=1 Tax=Glaciihabitans tibetensis TaxID=1266600 RepID=A0A2T0VFK3_9MICO|nr:hypothetical protein [Glaciihabitans tibetensis]PRY68942.1 hypothetical protein B0I08_103147 [Glaciihabitans tibetensis]
MSDGTPWQSPDGSPASSSPPPAGPPTPPAAPRIPPRYGEYAPVSPVSPAPPIPGGAGAPGGTGTGSPHGYPQAGAPGAGPRAWSPPPKPGLVPLQPMTLGTILAGSFQVMRRNPRPTFGVSLLINGIVAVISLAAVGLSFVLGFDRLATASSDTFDDITAGSNALSILSTLVTLAFGLVGSAILQGIISLEVARATLGEKLKARQLFALAKGRIAALIGYSVLVGVVLILVIGVVVAIIVALALSGTTAGVVSAVLLGIGAVLAGIVLGFWIATRLSLVPSVLLIERLRLFPAIRRSWSLTTGYFWRTLGIQLLVNVIVTTATQIIILPISFFLVFYATVTNPTGDVEALDNIFLLTTIITTVASALIGSVTAIIVSATSALIYIDLRIRKEGLDLELIKFVEARQGGASESFGTEIGGSLPDPYRPTTAKSGASTRSGAPSDPGSPTTPSDSPWA